MEESELNIKKWHHWWLQDINDENTSAHARHMFAYSPIWFSGMLKVEGLGSNSGALFTAWPKVWPVKEHSNTAWGQIYIHIL